MRHVPTLIAGSLRHVGIVICRVSHIGTVHAIYSHLTPRSFTLCLGLRGHSWQHYSFGCTPIPVATGKQRHSLCLYGSVHVPHARSGAARRTESSARARTTARLCHASYHGVWQPREARRYECIAAPDGSSSSFHWLGMAAACATAACMVREATSDALPQLQLLISQHVAKRSAARQSTICTMLSPIELPSNRLTNSTHMMPGSRPSSGEARNSRYSKLQLVPEACTPSERSRGFSGDNLAMLARVVRVRHRCDRLRPHAHHRGACVECGGEVGPRCLMHEK